MYTACAIPERFNRRRRKTSLTICPLVFFGFWCCASAVGQAQAPASAVPRVDARAEVAAALYAASATQAAAERAADARMSIPGYDEITRPDPGAHWDWVIQPADGSRAIQAALPRRPGGMLTL